MTGRSEAQEVAQAEVEGADRYPEVGAVEFVSGSGDPAAKLDLKTPSRELARHRLGESLTRREAMRAKCADCMCDYIDGRKDCGVSTCPLYPYRPYQRGGK